MTRIKIGTLQASMPDGEDYYIIEEWKGRRPRSLAGWVRVTKARAEELGFATLSVTFPNKKLADEVLNLSGLSWRK